MLYNGNLFLSTKNFPNLLPLPTPHELPHHSLAVSPHVPQLHLSVLAFLTRTPSSYLLHLLRRVQRHCSRLSMVLRVPDLVVVHSQALTETLPHLPPAHRKPTIHRFN